MRHLVVLGAGTAGTMVVNKLHRALPASQWRITVVDQDDDHVYQPGQLLLPFGHGRAEDLVKPRHRYLPHDVPLLLGEVDRVDAEAHEVRLLDGQVLPYDQLVIATGTSPRPDQTPGMTGPEWRRSVHEFYTLEGSEALRQALEAFPGGRIVVHVVEMPIKCPVAPLEFLLLAEAYFSERGRRDQVELVYATPLDAAFTKPVAAERLGHLLAERKIALEPDFVVDRVDGERKVLVSMDEREIPFDLLVTVPLNMGADFVARSGLGDELNHVIVDKGTFQSRRHPDVFALGDAANLPTSKAGSVAHFSVEVFVKNFLEHVAGAPMTRRFDGHANCFVESGHGKALLLDFNYETQPLPGAFPLPVVGPLRLLGESRLNHLGKLAFQWIYWNLLLPGRPLPLPSRMTTAGKRQEPAA